MEMEMEMEMGMEMQGHLLLQGGYCRAQLAQEKQGKIAGDHFIVEELLDFSDEKEDDAGLVADGSSDGGRGNCSAYSPTVTATDSCSNSLSGASLSLISDEFMFRSLAIADADLCEPYEDLAELEWLSNFVEESFSSEELQKQQLLSGIKTTSTPPANDSLFTPNDDSQQLTAEAALPGKARSKRARATPSTSTWSSHLLLAPTTESSSSENSDAANIQTKPMKRRKEMSLSALSPSLDGRRCLHCATDKTPQWRAGPMGPKTLCNACGVRYKSGRLMPEYRPAASPTFVTSKHSNSHRKVIELRRQKGLPQQHFLPVYDTATPSAAGDHFLIQHRLCDEFRPVF